MVVIGKAVPLVMGRLFYFIITLNLIKMDYEELIDAWALIMSMR